MQSAQILHIELSEGIPPLSSVTGYDGLFVVFWWHNLPLGHQEILSTQLPMPATQLINLIVQTITPAVGCHLLESGFKGTLPTVATLPKPTPPSFQSLMDLNRPLATLQHRLSTLAKASVSVIICSRDRAEQLAQCLHSLQNLTQPPQEIIVVDNAPTTEATHQLVTRTPGIKYVQEPRPGLSIARNTGIHHSTGEIVVFTDDDVIVHSNWITRLQQGFQDPRVMAVTGLMLPAQLDTEAQLIFHQGTGSPGWNYQALTFDSQFFENMKPRGVPVWRIGAGANMAFRRKVFELVGDFNEHLGAGAAGCSEDSELWYRVLAEGWTCRYEPTAVVFHYHRSDLESLKQQMYQYMRGHVVALLVQFARYQHWGNLRRLGVALPRYYSRLFLRGLFKGFRKRRSTVPTEILGCLAGVKYYLQNYPSLPLFRNKEI